MCETCIHLQPPLSLLWLQHGSLWACHLTQFAQNLSSIYHAQLSCKIWRSYVELWLFFKNKLLTAWPLTQWGQNQESHLIMLDHSLWFKETDLNFFFFSKFLETRPPELDLLQSKSKMKRVHLFIMLFIMLFIIYSSCSMIYKAWESCIQLFLSYWSKIVSKCRPQWVWPLVQDQKGVIFHDV